MMHTTEAAISLVDNKVRFTGTARENAPVALDYFPPLGYGKSYTGLELLFLSFAGCNATSVVYLLRKMGKDVPVSARRQPGSGATSIPPASRRSGRSSK